MRKKCQQCEHPDLKGMHTCEKRRSKKSVIPVPELARQLRFAHQTLGGEHLYGAQGGVIRVRLPDGSEFDFEMFQRAGERGLEIRCVRGVSAMGIRVEPVAGNSVRVGLR